MGPDARETTVQATSERSSTTDGSDADAPDGDAASGAGGEPTRTTTHRPGDEVVHPDAVERRFGRRGDALLVAIFLALFVVPTVIYVEPPGLDWRVRLLILPMVPGLALAAAAVWATTRP